MEILTEPRHKERLLTLLHHLPLVKTSQIAKLVESSSPYPIVSRMMKGLEQQKLVEWTRLPTTEKVWRLTTKGKKHFGVEIRSIPLNSMKLLHYLSFVDVYVALGMPKIFDIELREEFTHRNKKDVYSPDILTVWQKKAVLIEVQLKPLSSKDWSEKWAKANKFFNHDYYKKASWQRRAKGQPVQPEMIVITSQNPDNVREGFAVKDRHLTVLNDIKVLS